jgi:uncharacterized membrane protein YsdA (DUF1294 family)
MFVSEYAKLLSVREVRILYAHYMELEMRNFGLTWLHPGCHCGCRWPLHPNAYTTGRLTFFRASVMCSWEIDIASWFPPNVVQQTTLFSIFSHTIKRGTHGLNDKMPPNRPRPRHRPISPATIAGIFSLVLPTCTLIRLYAATHSVFPIAWHCIASGVTFVYYGYDKMQARNLEWRVKEVTLHVLALAGGWPGALLGMHYFQHKTRKTAFQLVFWTTVLAWEGFWWSVWTGRVRLN